MTTVLVKQALHSCDGNLLKDVVNIEHPHENYKNYVIHEYAGDVPRLCGNERSIELLLPRDMSVVMENAVVDAIESGTLFDDKKDIDNTVKYIHMTHLPHTGMMHLNLPEPHETIHAIGTVVGAMGPDGHFGHADSDIKNGANYARDLTDHYNDKDSSISDLTKDYLNVKDKNDEDSIPKDMKYSLSKVHDELDDVKKVKPEDTVDEDDYEEIGLDHEEDDDYDDDEEDDDECEECDDDECDDDEDDEEDSESDEDDEDDDEENEDEEDSDDEDDDEDDDNVDFKDEGAIENYIAKKIVKKAVKKTIKKGTKKAVKKGAKKSIKKARRRYHDEKNNDDKYGSAYHEYAMYQETGAMLIKPKKLKPIPRDVVAYIITRTNEIRDSNDQAMLSGYTCSKLELVDFYLNCIDTHDYRYIVPHNRQYLVQMQNDLNRCLQQILRVKPVNRLDRVWRLNVTYPEGFGG